MNQVKNRDLVILHLSLIKGVGPVLQLEMLAHYLRARQGNLSYDRSFIFQAIEDHELFEWYSYRVDDFRALGLSLKDAMMVVAGLADRTLLDAELALLEKHQVRVCTWFDADYPDLLKHIAYPPALLYCRGGMFAGRRMVAIVGSRKANRYGQSVIEELVPLLCSRGLTIVSGGALGADTMAHRVASRDGKTIVILGSGLLRPYPAENQRLFDAIVGEGGIVVSPFSLLTGPDRWNFPVRNRVIAGMTEASVVIQAAVKSGALITAHYALESGREVFAVPGMITDPLSSGCHALIRQGAALVESADDILNYYGLIASEHSLEGGAVEKGMLQQEIVSERDMVLKYLTVPRSIDDLCTETGLDLIVIQSMLFDLQLEGRVTQELSGLWVMIQR